MHGMSVRWLMRCSSLLCGLLANSLQQYIYSVRPIGVNDTFLVFKVKNNTEKSILKTRNSKHVMYSFYVAVN